MIVSYIPQIFGLLSILFVFLAYRKVYLNLNLLNEKGENKKKLKPILFWLKLESFKFSIKKFFWFWCPIYFRIEEYNRLELKDLEHKLFLNNKIIIVPMVGMIVILIILMFKSLNMF